MDRFDAYTSEMLAAQLLSAALREAARDRLACEAAGHRAAEQTSGRAVIWSVPSPARVVFAVAYRR
jgi:hypothetical protein